MPLTLTILSAAVPEERRGLALGAWGGISGLAVAFGPLVGGAVVSGISWHWIFWLNVPIGLVLAPLALLRLDESHGPVGALDLPGLGARERGPVRDRLGPRPRQLGRLELARDRRRARRRRRRARARSSAGSCAPTQPMLPMRFFRNRTFALANVSSLFMFFGMFGSIFLLAQFFQTVQGYSPLQSGLRILPWTAMPIFVAPIAGALSDRIGGHRLMGAGLALQAIGLGVDRGGLDADDAVRRRSCCRSSSPGAAWRSSSRRSRTSSSRRVRPGEEGQASGANNAIRELGGVFGVAVLASVFAHYGGYAHRRDVRRRDERRRLRRRGRRRASARSPRSRSSRGGAPRRSSPSPPSQSRSRVAAAATAAATTASTTSEPRREAACAMPPTSGGPISSPT